MLNKIKCWFGCCNWGEDFDKRIVNSSGSNHPIGVLWDVLFVSKICKRKCKTCGRIKEFTS